MEKIIELAEQLILQARLHIVATQVKDELIAEQKAEIGLKEKEIADLKAQLQQATVKPLETWVTGQLLAGSQVRWTLHLSMAQPQLTYVKVAHTDTKTGLETFHTWSIPTGQTSVSGVYSYAPTLKSASFKVLQGEGYSLATDSSRPTGVHMTLGVPAPEPVIKVGIDWQPPLTITKGGVYEGFWRSADSTIPAVSLRTSEPVKLVNYGIQTAGFGIENHGGQTNLAAIGGFFEALPHTGNQYNDPRRAFSVNNVINLEIINCSSEGMGFLTTQGNYLGTGAQSIKVLKNKVRNINGLTKAGRSNANFVQLMNIKNGIPNVEIGYNEVANEYGFSDLEDTINIFKSKGIAGSPIKIYGNLMQGAFYHPSIQKSYSGGGIIADSPDATDVTAYLEVYENYLVGIGNYCLGIASGNNIRFHHNYCIVSGDLGNGKTFSDLHLHASGMWAKDYYQKGQTFSNVFEGNTVGVNYGTGRKDISEPAGAAWVGTVHLLDPVTKATEELYVKQWQNMIRAKGLSIGAASIM